MLGVETNNLKIVNDLPNDSKEITDSTDESAKEMKDQKQEEEKVIDFSRQELDSSMKEIQEKAEPAYKYANDLISAIDWDKNPDFIKKREEKYEEIKNDPKHSWESDLWKRTTAFALTWNSVKDSWELISDDEYTDDTVDKAVRYMMALWDATNAAEQLAVFKSQRSMYENVVNSSTMQQRESAIV